MGAVLYLCFKILWVFTFVELCIVAFIMLLHNTDMAELKKRILPTGPTASLKVSYRLNHENVDRNIVELSERLAKERREVKKKY
ncbi:uncharacterized protein LOC105276326 isoform X1 [Ooceraea biroi]|uniref:uncharacterized protein LOC105276326 isoform X1 n=1 Tax=Ooceraea biroi TaxID=2015173 RepID=UPI000F0826E0|nr:uncharacterized protein LOC105276326 isoform X1 [Ooceraea biroi]